MLGCMRWGQVCWHHHQRSAIVLPKISQQKACVRTASVLVMWLQWERSRRLTAGSKDACARPRPLHALACKEVSAVSCGNTCAALLLFEPDLVCRVKLAAVHGRNVQTLGWLHSITLCVHDAQSDTGCRCIQSLQAASCSQTCGLASCSSSGVRLVIWDTSRSCSTGSCGSQARKLGSSSALQPVPHSTGQLGLSCIAPVICMTLHCMAWRWMAWHGMAWHGVA